MPDVLHGRASAKVNLVLEVLLLRDDGFHEIDTIFQELELADEVEVSFGSGAGMTIAGAFAAGTPSDETNLAWRAAATLAARAGESPAGLRIHILKQIPPREDWAAGASDAATVLRLLGRAWPAVTPRTVREVAAEIGSDEAFFLVGGTARGPGAENWWRPCRSSAP